MNLFHETENKYYEILSYMLQNKKLYSIEEITEYLSTNLIGEIDYEVIEALFSKKEGEDAIYAYSNGYYKPVLSNVFPIRLNEVEKLAFYSLVGNKNTKHFLREETISKLHKECEAIEELWNINDIQIKNQYQYGAIKQQEVYTETLHIIMEAIRMKKGIVYDNVLKGKYEYIDKHAFPIRIEYSFINDVFRVSVYDTTEQRFVKMNLSTLKNIRLSEKIHTGIEAEYQNFIQENTKIIELDVEAIDHVIERCFRIFSYYDRRACYDKEEKKYKLSISYLKQDENEIIRDILSLGSYAVVIAPKRIQKEIYRRLLETKKLYEN